MKHSVSRVGSASVLRKNPIPLVRQKDLIQIQGKLLKHCVLILEFNDV
jgi:hypothetical protein